MRITVPGAWQTLSANFVVAIISPTSMKEAGEVAFSTGHPSLLAGEDMACSSPTRLLSE